MRKYLAVWLGIRKPYRNHDRTMRMWVAEVQDMLKNQTKTRVANLWPTGRIWPTKQNHCSPFTNYSG